MCVCINNVAVFPHCPHIFVSSNPTHTHIHAILFFSFFPPENGEQQQQPEEKKLKKRGEITDKNLLAVRSKLLTTINIPRY